MKYEKGQILSIFDYFENEIEIVDLGEVASNLNVLFRK